MIYTEKKAQVTLVETTTQGAQQPPATVTSRRNKKSVYAMAWICLLLSCVGVGWFAYQYFLIPQPRYYTPNWHGAQWVRATDGNGAIGYFRYTPALKTLPDHVFVTLAASQVFNLYVNGTQLGSSGSDFNNYPRAYMYEITSFLTSGTNDIAIQVDNLDNQLPMLRASVTIMSGRTVAYYGTGTGANWLATTQAALVYPQNTAISQSLTAWTGQKFTTTAWQPVRAVAQAPIMPSLTVNQSLYEQPFAPHWMSAGARQDAYFVQQVSLPTSYSTIWLRLATIGTTDVFINGNPVITWDAQVIQVRQNVVNRETRKIVVRYAQESEVGVYDVSSYVHSGLNTLAVHVSLQTTNGLKATTPSGGVELGLDLLNSDDQGHIGWIASPDGWRFSYAAVPGWTTADGDVASWRIANDTGSSDGYRLVYLSQNNVLSGEQQESQILPLTWSLEVISCTVCLMLASWLIMSLAIRRYFPSIYAALAAVSLVYVPALAVEGFLIALAQEPVIARPFPYTRLWGLTLTGIVAASYLLLWLYALISSASVVGDGRDQSVPTFSDFRRKDKGSGSVFFSWALSKLKTYWPLILILLLSLPLVFYNLGYEPYWQDELDSYNVAQSILHTGLSLLPSGFVYPKGELYSYCLALFIKIFGNQAGTPRILSGIAYLLTVALFYRVGRSFFDRRVALVATVMLAFSTQELLWARQIRMYQQAQFFTLLTVYLFYKAVQNPRRKRSVYLAVGVLLATYLSHEETFIILPALLIGILYVAFVTRERGQRLPSVLYQKHWWYAAAIAVAVIGVQLVIVNVTHPPMLGTDSSTRPEIQLTTDNLTFYFNMLFWQSTNYPSVISGLTTPAPVLNSILAVLGCFWARKSNSPGVKYVAVLLSTGFLTLLFLFTMQSTRYFYPLATFYYLLSAYALMKILRAIWTFVRSHRLRTHFVGNAMSGSQIYTPLSLRVLMAAITIPVCLTILLLPVFPLYNYNLFVSRVAGLPYYRHFGDYDKTGLYVQSHMRKGDVVISIIPDPEVLYYVGQSDYFFSIDRALFLFEENGHIVDTYTGNPALIRQSDLDTVLSTHTRVWLIADEQNYQRDVFKRFIISSDFHIVYVGPNSIVYLRGG